MSNVEQLLQYLSCRKLVVNDVREQRREQTRATFRTKQNKTNACLDLCQWEATVTPQLLICLACCCCYAN